MMDPKEIFRLRSVQTLLWECRELLEIDDLDNIDSRIESSLTHVKTVLLANDPPTTT